MKKIFVIMCMCMCAGVFAQDGTLRPIDVENTSEKNPVLQYLLANYKATSEEKASPLSGVLDCGFTQTFENGLTYEKRNCGTAALATGEVLTISNPDRLSVINWVETLNKIFGDYDQNAWNFDQTTYIPVKGIPGAIFEIYRDLNTTTILVMSGC